MQQEVLEKHPALDIRVYTIWLPVYFSDTRSAWDANVMSDERVTHFWDEERIVGQWLVEHTNAGSEGTIYGSYWDRYFLYDGSAAWEADGITEEPLITNYPIIYYNDDLLEQMKSFGIET